MSALRLYRLSNARRAGDLSGEGARRAGGRWNEAGTPALYTATTISLALLECLVHVGAAGNLPKGYTVNVLELGAKTPNLHRVEELPARLDESQQVGNALLIEENVLGFYARSVVVPSEWNVVLNPRHPTFGSSVRLVETYALAVDRRLGIR